MADTGSAGEAGTSPASVGLGDGGGELAGIGQGSQGPVGSGQGAGSATAAKESSPVQPRPAKEAGEVERKIAPIPPKKSRLPGVMSDDDFPELKVPLQVRREKQAQAEAQEGRQRDEQGRFLPKAPESGVASAPASKPGLPGTTVPPAEPAAAAPFKFAGRDYKSQAEAEQSHRSLQGMFKPLQDERDYGYRAANAWMAESQRHQARVAELEKQLGIQPGNGNGHAPATPSESAPLSVEDLTKGIDFDAYEAVAKAGGLKHSANYLAGELMKVMAEKMLPDMEKRLQAKYAPLMDSHEGYQRAQQAEQVRAQIAALMTPDNSRAMFPEMVDSAALTAAGQIWRQMGGSDEDLITPRGMLSAIGLYRATREWQTPESIANQSPVAAAPSVAPPAPGPAAMPSAEAVGNLPPNRGRTNLSPEAARLKNAMENVPLIDRKLGFARNRSAQ